MQFQVNSTFHTQFICTIGIQLPCSQVTIQLATLFDSAANQTSPNIVKHRTNDQKYSPVIGDISIASKHFATDLENPKSFAGNFTWNLSRCFCEF